MRHIHDRGGPLRSKRLRPAWIAREKQHAPAPLKVEVVPVHHSAGNLGQISLLGQVGHILRGAGDVSIGPLTINILDLDSTAERCVSFAHEKRASRAGSIRRRRDRAEILTFRLLPRCITRLSRRSSPVMGTPVVAADAGELDVEQPGRTLASGCLRPSTGPAS